MVRVSVKMGLLGDWLQDELKSNKEKKITQAGTSFTDGFIGP